MYLDEDGIATIRSQAVYNSRMRILLLTTILLSWVGFAATALDGDYSRDNSFFPLSLEQYGFARWSKFLWPLICFNSLGYYWKKESPLELYTAGLRGSLLSLLTVSSKVLSQFVDNEESSFAVLKGSLQVHIAIILAVLQILFPRRPDLFDPEGRLVDLESSSSALRRYSMHWCTAAVALAGRAVTIDELPVLNYLTRSKSQKLLVIGSSSPSLWNQILAERYSGFVKQWALMVVRSIVTFGSPYCVMRLLKSLEDGQTDKAWIWLIGIGVFSACYTTINHHLIWIQWSEMAIPVQAQLIMSIFQKQLRRKDSKDEEKCSGSGLTSGKPVAINLISSDTFAFSKFTAVNYIIPSSFVRFLLAALFLLRLFGWQSTLVGMIVTALSVPVHTVVIKQQRAAQKSLTAARDKKTKVINEALYALRQIKFSALEAQWEEHIDGFRQEELKHLRWSFTISTIRSVWGIAAPFLVAFSSLYTYAYLHGAITPSIIFPMIEVLPHLQGTLGFVPVVFQDYFGARSNASRMEEFLRRPEQRRILDPSPSGHISFQDAIITWPRDEGARAVLKNLATPPGRFILCDINLNFPVGELSVISGETGSGKSLLLAAIIGEVELLAGRVEAPSAADGYPVGFVSQTPWLQNTTIRENIMFGKPFDNDRYQKVLAACALQPDLKALAKGDETRIGLRGVKLSGGQRARVAFGRALYSNAQILVLDDIFSALDSHVSKEIFNALTGELGWGRTRIVVTHQKSLCLPKAKYMVHLENNTIGYAGSTDSVEKIVGVTEGDPGIDPKLPAEERAGLSTSDPKGKALQSKPAPKVTRAKKHNYRTDLTVYKRYFAAAGGIGFTLLYLVGLVTKQLLSALATWLLGRTNSSRPRNIGDQQKKSISVISNEGDGLQQLYMYLYCGSSFLAVILQCVFSLHTFSGSLLASKVLFREIISNVLRMPVLWLDTTPIGGMIRVFAVETRMVDDLMLVTISEFADCLVRFMTIVGVGLYTSRYTTFLTVALLLWCAHVSKGYIKARSMVKSADAAPTADILEHFTSSATGISTLRAFGVLDKSIEKMHQHIDRLSTARRHSWIFNRWLGLQMSYIGILFSTGTGIILLSSKSIIDTSLMGFCLTFSMGLSQAIFKAVNNFGMLETYMNAAGSVVRYTELQTEPQGGAVVPSDWPSKGEVEVKGLSIAYSIDLPLVLKDVSFTIGAGQRLGIVGRTGAGKSSLTLSLLRLLEPQSGSITIDGLDISTVKLRDLRSRIAFIPQDPVLFSGTVRSNLDYFSQVPETRLNKALRRVNLLAEQGDEKGGLFTLDSPISAGGTNMSQGQRQLLCLARLLIRNPSIIVLDEATSAVDNATDLSIQNTIRTEFSGTLIVVAHRLRTIAGFEKVLVLSGGMVTEMGTPEELLQQEGAFYDLVRDSEDREFFMG
ncbi:ABC multidrug transporter [Xylariales sp. AK1849]|nr:ABC multidrug transporter [Xylariales sp. AK1849]